MNHPHICVLYDVGQSGWPGLPGDGVHRRVDSGEAAGKGSAAAGASVEVRDANRGWARQGASQRRGTPGFEPREHYADVSASAKLLDFGLAKPTARLTSVATLTAAVRQSTTMTEQGVIVGIFQYMSPEQIEGTELDSRSDIFRLALCCTRCLQAGVRSKAKASSAIHSNCARPLGDADVLGTRQAHPAPNRN
jgi:eukaryotic-like serine/threonine-protein kinase